MIYKAVTETLENDFLKVVFDARYGKLLKLENKVTGWHIQNREELALSFDMLVPLPDKRNNRITGQKQDLTSLCRDEDGKRLTFTWSRLNSEFTGALDIVFTGIVSLEGGNLVFSSEVQNNSPYTVETVSYPCFGDISMPSPEEPIYRMHGEYAGMGKVELLPHFFNNMGYWGVDNPMHMVATPRSMFVLVGNDKQGLYTGCHDASCRELIQFTFELKPGNGESLFGTLPTEEEFGGKPVHLEYRLIHFPFLNSGESRVLSPVAVCPYTGTWHKGADIYKEWRKTWFKSPHTPEWAKEVHSWMQLHINSPEDELRCRYKDLVKYGEECARHDVKAIQLTGWNYGGQDRGNPSHDTDPRLGSWEDLKEAIDKIQSMGVKVVLFNKYTWSDRSLEWFRNKLVDYSAKDPYGDYYVYEGYSYQTPTQLSNINTRHLIPMCMNSAEWHKICCNEFKKSIGLGASGMLYDECQHHGGAFYCFDKNHGHHVPENIYAGDSLLSQDFHTIADSIDADFMFAGEALYDMQYSDYSMAYFRIEQGHIPLQRYINPNANIMVAATGFNDRCMLDLCLLYRYIISYEPYMFKGSIKDFPRTLEYGKKVDALRKRYKDYLWEAEYIDTQEALVMTDGKPHFPYSVFRQPETGKRAVAVANHNQSEEIKVMVVLDNPSRNLVSVSPEMPEPQNFYGNICIPQRSVAVIMEI
jgi:hypothetical protein